MNDITDDAYNRIKNMIGDEPGQFKKARLRLTDNEKLSVYRSILDALEAGTDNKTTASNIMVFLNNFLIEKEEAHNKNNIKSGPIFRRVDD